MSCGVGCRCGSDPALLWLWCRPAAAVVIWPPSLQLPYAPGVTLHPPQKKDGMFFLFLKRTLTFRVAWKRGLSHWAGGPQVPSYPPSLPSSPAFLQEPLFKTNLSLFFCLTFGKKSKSQVRSETTWYNGNSRHCLPIYSLVLWPQLGSVSTSVKLCLNILMSGLTASFWNLLNL